jgi:hypothetical protein
LNLIPSLLALALVILCPAFCFTFIAGLTLAPQKIPSLQKKSMSVVRLHRRTARTLGNRHSSLLLAFSFCAALLLYCIYQANVEDEHSDEDGGEENDGEAGIDYEWVGVYTDAKGVEREVPIVQRRDGVIFLTSFNFYSVVNLDVYHPAFILWTVDNSDLCDEAETAMSVAVRELVSPLRGPLTGDSSEKRYPLYAQYRINPSDEDDVRLLKSRGLGSNDFPTLSVVHEVNRDGKKHQTVIGFSGPLSTSGFKGWTPSRNKELGEVCNKSTVCFENGILRL